MLSAPNNISFAASAGAWIFGHHFCFITFVVCYSNPSCQFQLENTEKLTKHKLFILYLGQTLTFLIVIKNLQISTYTLITFQIF